MTAEQNRDNASWEDLEQRWVQMCLRMPGSFIDHPFGPDSTVIKVAGRDRQKARLFAILMVHHGELILNVKCEPTLADQQRSEYPLITPGYHMNKKHWNSLHRGLSDELVQELIEDSYDLVVEGMPRRDKEALGWQSVVDKGSTDA